MKNKKLYFIFISLFLTRMSFGMESEDLAVQAVQVEIPEVSAALLVEDSLVEASGPSGLEERFAESQLVFGSLLMNLLTDAHPEKQRALVPEDMIEALFQGRQFASTNTVVLKTMYAAMKTVETANNSGCDISDMVSGQFAQADVLLQNVHEG